jgi:hypothetical protein
LSACKQPAYLYKQRPIMNFDETTFSYAVSELSVGVLKVEMMGALNEDAYLNDVIDEVLQMTGSHQSVVLDLSRITSINSCGVRSWLLFIEKIQMIMKCKLGILSNIFVEQANTVSNMIGKPALPIFAFEAPYYCPKCDLQVTKVLESSKIKKEQGQFKAPVFPCPKCNDAGLRLFRGRIFFFFEASQGIGSYE